MESLIQFTPVKSLHLWVNFIKGIVYPRDNIIEIVFQFGNVLVTSMFLHVVFDISMTNPSQGFLKNFLSVDGAVNITSPFLHMGIFLVAEFLASCTHEGTGVNGIQFFLFIETDATDIDDFKPFLDFRFSTLTDVSQHLGILNEYSFFLV